MSIYELDFLHGVKVGLDQATGGDIITRVKAGWSLGIDRKAIGFTIDDGGREGGYHPLRNVGLVGHGPHAQAIVKGTIGIKRAQKVLRRCLWIMRDGGL